MKELQLIQSALKAPKGQTNAFGKYKYRSCEDILEALKPLLEQQECSLVINDEIVMVGERYYVKATATVSHEDRQISVSAFARESFSKKGMDDAQLTGSCSSYARKYALNGLFAIDDTKDSDSRDNSYKAPKRADINKHLATFEKIEEFQAYAKSFPSQNHISWVDSSGKQGGRETWGQLFEMHSKRIKGENPINVNQTPEDMQKEFNEGLKGDTQEILFELQKLYENNRCLQTDANDAAIQEFQKKLEFLA